MNQQNCPNCNHTENCPYCQLNLAKEGLNFHSFSKATWGTLEKGGKPVLLFTNLIFSSNSLKELISHHLISGTYWVRNSIVACWSSKFLAVFIWLILAWASSSVDYIIKLRYRPNWKTNCWMLEHLNLPSITVSQLAEKLTYYGLETNLAECGEDIYLEFIPLPNRPDLLSWRGIISETGILLNCSVKPTTIPVINESQPKLIELVITTKNCLEFHLDAANLVMLENGQPLHIFDYDTLSPQQKITIRETQTGEVLTNLHGEKTALNTGDIVLSSGEKIISLAGIIGTQETALTPQSQNILIECASFNSEVIKKSSKSLNISTAASQYFSQGANLVLSPKKVLARVISLITETYGGNLNSATVFTYQEAPQREKKIITISQEFIEKKTGQKLTNKVIENI
ncbi:1300_t:CDS:2 [Entrophospora sp. SA101]|nr:1300_t:CDS:2 [Entrophospora sp. SA101]